MTQGAGGETTEPSHEPLLIDRSNLIQDDMPRLPAKAA